MLRQTLVGICLEMSLGHWQLNHLLALAEANQASPGQQTLDHAVEEPAFMIIMTAVMSKGIFGPNTGLSSYIDSQNGPNVAILRATHLAVLSLKVPPVMVTTVGVPQATIAPPTSSAWFPLNVPPSIVT